MEFILATKFHAKMTFAQIYKMSRSAVEDVFKSVSDLSSIFQNS